MSPQPAVRNQATKFTATGTCAASPCTYQWLHGDASSTDQLGTGPSISFTYTGASANLNVDLSVPVLVPIGIRSSKLGQQGLLWNDPTIWDNPVLAAYDAVTVTETVLGAGSGDPAVLLDLPNTIDVLVNSGPTERSLSVPLGVTSTSIPGLNLSFSATANTNNSRARSAA